MSKTAMDKDLESPGTPPPTSESLSKTFRPDRQTTSLLDRDDPGGVDTTLVAYDKKALTKVLQDLELNLERAKILPLIDPFGPELANKLSLGALDLQSILEY